jgi:hypothetical protein
LNKFTAKCIHLISFLSLEIGPLGQKGLGELHIPFLVEVLLHSHQVPLVKTNTVSLTSFQSFTQKMLQNQRPTSLDWNLATRNTVWIFNSMHSFVYV